MGSYKISQTNPRKYSVAPFVKDLLERNTDIVDAGGYPAIATGAGNINCSTILRNTFGYTNWNRIRQPGLITKFSYYVATTAADLPNITNLVLKIWRKDGATFDLVAEEDFLNKISGVLETVAEITLDTPILVERGDYVGFEALATETNTKFLFATGTGDIFYEDGAEPSDTDYDWLAQTSLTVNQLTKVFMQAPLIVGIGDSLIAGHGLHNSYLEQAQGDAPEKTIMGKLNTLDSRFIYQNMGIGGEASTAIEARFTADVVDLKPKYSVILAGVNDLAGSVDKSIYLANMTSMLDLCNANNIIPIIIKILPWTNGTNIQMQSRDDWMADLKVIAGNNSSIFIDCDSTIGQFRIGGDVGNLWDIQTVYDDDGVHLTEAGYTKIAELIFNNLL